MDVEFEKVTDKLRKEEVIIAAEREHKGELESKTMAEKGMRDMNYQNVTIILAVHREPWTSTRLMYKPNIS